MKKWEFKTAIHVANGSAQDFNDLGVDGWELVSVTIQENYMKYHFKRPIQ